jgi:hypothetical protein
MDDQELERRIGALLRGPPQSPDEAFVRRMERLVLAEQRIEKARRSAWRRFAAEAAASAAVLSAFLLLGRLGLESNPNGSGLLSPATAAVMLIGLWFAVELRPAAKS